MARKIGAVIALDGEQKFKNAVTACTKSLNNMRSELKLAEAQASTQSKSLTALEKKHEALNNVLAATKVKEEATRREFEKAEKGYETAGKKLDEYQKELKESRDALDKMKASGTATAEEIAKQKEAVGEAAKAVDRAERSYESAGNRAEDWQRKLRDAKTETLKAEKAVEDNADAMEELRSATDTAADQLDEFGDEAKDAAGKTGQLDISLKSMIKNAAVNLAVDALRTIASKAGEAAQYVMRVGSDFEASMSKVKSISGATGGDFDKLTQKAREMGSTTKFSASEAAEAMNYMAMAGWKTEDMLSGIEGVMNLAAASGEDLATTSDIVTDALTAFGLSAEQSGEMADVLAATSANANTNVSMLGESFKYAAPVAGALGASMQDTSVALGLMANSGIKASQAGTALRTGLSNLAKPTKQMQEYMDQYNIELKKNDDGSVNLRDTMIDLREKMGNLSTTEQAAAASAIFGKEAMSGWLAVINTSEEDFNKLTTAIDNSEGSAAEMAKTMQDNLSGAVTTFNSALEGFGIELFDKISGPATKAVGVATKAVNALTEALHGHKKENDEIVDQIKNANDELEKTLSASGSVQAETATKVGQISVLGEALIELNKKTKLDERERARLKAVYDELVEVVPDLAGHYDEETGKINLATDAIRDMVDARKDELIQAGKMKALQSVYEALGEAQGKLALATANISGIERQRKMWEELQSTLGDARDEYYQLTNKFGEAADLSALDGIQSTLMGIAQEALNTGTISKDTYDRIEEMMKGLTYGYSEAAVDNIWTWLQEEMKDTDVALSEASEGLDELKSTCDEAERAVTNLEKATDSERKIFADSATSINAMTDEKMALKKATEDTKESTEESTEATKEEKKTYDDSAVSVQSMTDEKLALKKVIEETTEATEDGTDALEEATAAVRAQAEAEKAMRDAAQQARDDMAKTFEDIQKSVDSMFSLNPFEQWQQDIEKGWEAFDGSMLSQIEGMKNYRDNMTLIKEHLGTTAPDFVQYLEDMGQSGAQFADDLARGIREGGDASMASIDYTVSLWRENHSMEDEIKDSFARSKLETALGLAGLSETAVLGWEELGYAFDEGVGVIRAGGEEMSQETSNAFWQAVDVAKSVAMEVPKGAAEAIRNSDDPEQATIEQTETINECLRSRGLEMIEGARQFGALIPQGVEEVLTDPKSTGEQIQSAVSSLAESLKKEGISGMDEAGTAIGEAASDATATGITNKETDVSNAADDVVGAAKGSAATASELFSLVGGSAMEAMKVGFAEKQEGVSTNLKAHLTVIKNQAKTKAEEIYDEVGESMISTIAEGFDDTSKITSAIDTLNTEVSGKMETLVSTVQSAMDNIKNATNFSWELPHLPLPHVVTGWDTITYGDGAWVQIPRFSVNWYAKAMANGMILDSPTIFGMQNGNLLGAGEAGSETVVGTTSLMSMIQSAVNDSMAGPGDNGIHGTNDRLDALINILGDYIPQILDASKGEKVFDISNNYMGILSQRTSETIGQNVRRSR